MAKKQRPTRLLGVELLVMGQPTGATRLADGLASAGVVAPELFDGAGSRFLVEWPMAVEVVPDDGDSFVGSVPAVLLLEGSDVDRLWASLRGAGWAPET
jgi:hypothetical protein